MTDTALPEGATSTDKVLGAPVRRGEDERLLAGRGAFVGDVRRPGMVDAVFVRSPVPHGRLIRVDRPPVDTPGLLGVFTASDLDDVVPVPDLVTWQQPVGHFPLAADKVRHVGEPVAVVLGTDRYVAEDAAELVGLVIEELPLVADPQAALAPDAPLLYESWGRNVLGGGVTGDPAATGAVFARPDAHVVSVRCTTQRQASAPIEPRGVVAEWDGDRFTIWSSTQVPHMVRALLAKVLGLSERRIRVIATDLGGGFGVKSQIHPEEFVVPWLARRLGQPVRWIEDRHEHMIAATQARDVVVELEGAFEADGRLRATRGRVVQDAGTGAIYPSGGACGWVSAGATHGPYRIEQHSVEVQLVVTNKMATGAYRGFGAPEGIFAIERLMDAAADSLGIDPVTIRRRNLLDPSDLPYTTPGGTRFATGSHRAAFERAVELGDAALTDEQERGAGSSEVLGVGVVPYVQGTAATYFAGTGYFTSQDSCTIRFDADGGVNVLLGIAACGQGAVTTATAVAAHALGVPFGDVRVAMGDTDVTPLGLGAWGSRGTVVAAGSIAAAAARLVSKAGTIAVHLLAERTGEEVDPGSLEVADGWFTVAGQPGRRVSWAEIAEAALVVTWRLPPGMEPGLEAHAGYLPPGLTDLPTADGMVNACAAYTNQAHAAVVAVDLGTGRVRVVRYLMVTDCGTVVNPLLVTGQLHGGAVQGIGAALMEELAYRDGIPLAITLAAYRLPTAVEAATLSVELVESPDPAMPFGIKGVGECSISGPPAAIAQAIEDAVRRSGQGFRPLRDLPFTPDRIRSHLRGRDEVTR